MHSRRSIENLNLAAAKITIVELMAFNYGESMEQGGRVEIN